MAIDNTSVSLGFKVLLGRIFQFFLQGLVVIAPIGITLWVVLTLFNTVDDILPNFLHVLFPNWIERNAEGSIEKIPGLGFIVVIVLVIIIGWISSLFVVGKLVDLFDKILESTPGIKFIYSSVKDFLGAFAGNKKKFDKPVLVNVDGNDVWRIGFITREENADLAMDDYITVYVPHSYAISGITYIVPTSKIKILKGISAANAMKYTVSGGVTDLLDEND